LCLMRPRSQAAKDRGDASGLGQGGDWQLPWARAGLYRMNSHSFLQLCSPMGGLAGLQQEDGDRVGGDAWGRNSRSFMHPHVGNGILLKPSPILPPPKSGTGTNGKNIPYVLISCILVIMLLLAMQPFS
jgi:hypothetical protein